AIVQRTDGTAEINLQKLNKTAPGQAVQTGSPPQGSYSQRKGFSTYNVGDDDQIKVDDGRNFSGRELKAAMTNASPEAKTAFLERNPALIVTPDNNLQVRSPGVSGGAVGGAQAVSSGQSGSTP